MSTLRGASRLGTNSARGDHETALAAQLTGYEGLPRCRRRWRTGVGFLHLFLPLSVLVDRLRRAVARRFFVALRRATHRLPSRLRTVAKERVLVIAPHMDDEAIPCGGTLVLHTRAGSTVHVLFTTDSSGLSSDPAARAHLRATRQREVKAAQAVLGYQSAESLDFPDGALVKHEPALRERLRAAIAQFAPTQILCPFPADSHGDHQATAVATAHAAAAANFGGEIWSYEVWTPLWPNACIDITSVAAEKERAIACYASQLDDRDYLSAVLGLNRYRGLRHQVPLAEAYYVCPTSEFRTLTAALDRLP
jgi:LmbE family N-acetylglucosaminyl deacetylase